MTQKDSTFCANKSTTRLQCVNKTLTSVFTKKQCVFFIAKFFSTTLQQLTALPERWTAVMSQRVIKCQCLSVDKNTKIFPVLEGYMLIFFYLLGFERIKKRKGFSLGNVCQRNQSISYKLCDKSLSRYVQGLAAEQCCTVHLLVQTMRSARDPLPALATNTSLLQSSGRSV